MHLPRHDYVTCISPGGLHRMAYAQWGDPKNPRVIICAHGLTRSHIDFHPLAQALASEFRVICPDVVGRGASDWLRFPEHYAIPQYVSDMVTLIARLNTNHIYWLGTSMGGLIGMTLASLKLNPIQKLVINDVGPRINLEGLKRIASYAGKPTVFADFSEAIAYSKDIASSFGPHTDEDWVLLTESIFRQNAHQLWELKYDPLIQQGFNKFANPDLFALAETAMWAAYDSIDCPTLLVRGAESDILSRETAHEMTQRGPRPKLIEINGVGHAPTFFSHDQVAMIREFFI